VIAGGTTGTATLTATSDTIYEGSESVNVAITGVTNGSENGVQQQTVTITDDDSAPTVTLSVDNSSISESGGVATITATLSNATTQNVTVSLGYTGTAGSSDYLASASSIVITGGTTGTATLTATSDIIYEGSESVIVAVIGVTNGSENGVQQQTVTITDDDSPPTISINDKTVAEGNSGTTAAAFTVSLSGASGKTVTVDYETGGGSATPNADYTAIGNTTLTFSPGETTKTINVSVTGDTVVETNETFQLELSNPIDGFIADSIGVGTILNDDSQVVANYDSYSISKDTVLTVDAPGILSNDSGGGGSLTAENFSSPSHGFLASVNDGSFIYTPDNGFTGTDSFNYQATDGITNSTAATVTIVITPAIYIDCQPDTWDFGQVGIGKSNKKAFVITNTGSSNLNITTVAITGDSSFASGDEGANFTLGSGSKLEIEVEFTPSLLGSNSAVLSLTHDGGGPNPLEVVLNGKGKNNFNWQYIIPILTRNIPGTK
ncbi:MAG: choice-of-anchor D domain-containing protein, partial [Gammaproteobacteria bacterium]|nr:choice-of-anchor D domain-containing protein [Gammaproteobacteria bacterium]